MRLGMEQPQKEQASEEDEREQLGISKQDWEAAFGWADQPAGEAAPVDGPFLVWPCNWEPVMVFMACTTQWSRRPNGSFAGLNYPGVDVVLSRTRLPKRAADATFAKLQRMELAALEVLNG